MYVHIFGIFFWRGGGGREQQIDYSLNLCLTYFLFLISSQSDYLDTFWLTCEKFCLLVWEKNVFISSSSPVWLLGMSLHLSWGQVIGVRVTWGWLKYSQGSVRVFNVFTIVRILRVTWLGFLFHSFCPSFWGLKTLYYYFLMFIVESNT